MTMTFEVLGTDCSEAWLRRLQDVGHDFYYLPDYHRLAEDRGEGTAALFVYAKDEFTIVLPLLLRSLAAIKGLADDNGSELSDATSVYGYAGPLASHKHLHPTIIADFQLLLAERLSELRVVTLFSRMHPLLASRACTVGLGELHPQGRTVSIDLTASQEEQFGGFRSNHRRNIRKLREMGFECGTDRSGRHLREFVRIYHETMSRVGASPWYFFDFEYFQRLLEIDGLTLMTCRKDGVLTAGAVLSAWGPVAQYHLGGTSNEWLKEAPMKLIFDEARRWASGKGCSALHLGGGLGSREDALFSFKLGFSKRVHDFFTWRWVLDENAYARLQAARRETVAALSESDRSFFPA